MNNKEEIKPENLKRIAKVMGYEAELVVISATRHYIDIFSKDRKNWLGKYNPNENASQLLEIIEKFKLDICYDHDRKEWEAYYNNNAGCMVGKTLSDAVLSAMVKTIENNNEQTN